MGDFFFNVRVITDEPVKEEDSTFKGHVVI